MYAWVAFPLLRITVLFSAGIVLAVELPLPISKSSTVLGLISFFFIYMLIWKVYQRCRFYSLNLLFGFMGHLLILMSGYAILLFHNDQYNLDHLLYKQNILAYEVEITENPHKKENSIRILGEIITVKDSVGWKPASGKVFVYIKKGEGVPNVAYGDVLIIHGSPSLTQRPKNPGEFNYKRYLSYQNIYHQDFITADEFVILEQKTGYLLYSFAIQSREFLKNILYKHLKRDREQAIALALLIGNKGSLTSEINEAYAAAGAMHVLAVSGLHVGIIYALMLFFFKRHQKGKIMKWVFLLLTLSGLWSYALVTGLSASVLRAVVMFSLMTIAKVTKRESNIYNTLSTAGLALLCYNPYMIMSVGFQLSFLAVFGIVYITPKIYQLLTINQFLLDKMWEVTCVSIAAQVATAPLVLLYFHQFPSYFLLSNLVVIPAAFGILISGITLFVCDMMPYISDAVGFILEQLIYWTNEFVYLIERLPNNTIDNLYINTTQSWLIILSIVMLFVYLYYKRTYQFIVLSLIILCFVVIRENRILENIQKKEIVFYSISNYTAIDFIHGDEAVLITDSTLLDNTDKIRFHVKPKRLSAGIGGLIDEVNEHRIVRQCIGENELIVWNEKSILILKKYNAQIEKIKVDVVVVAENSLYNMDQLNAIDHELVILDGSNSHYRTNKLMQQAQIDKNYHVINLMENGAYTMTL